MRQIEWCKIYNINTWYIGLKLKYKDENLAVNIKPLTTCSLYHSVRLDYAFLTRLILPLTVQKCPIYLRFTIPAHCWLGVSYQPFLMFAPKTSHVALYICIIIWISTKLNYSHRKVGLFIHIESVTLGD